MTPTAEMPPTGTLRMKHQRQVVLSTMLSVRSDTSRACQLGLLTLRLGGAQ
jgi:hypothetical protein